LFHYAAGMNADVQTWVAFGAIGVTALIFLWRLTRKNSSTGCGKGCGCGSTELKKATKS
jgi:hypothetical protein